MGDAPPENKDIKPKDPKGYNHVIYKSTRPSAKASAHIEQIDALEIL